MKKLAIASALLSALAITGTAHAYQAEVGATAGLIDPDHGSSRGLFGVDGTYYFNPVQTRNAPLAEAAFLDRASNVNAHYDYTQIGDVKNNVYGIGGEYYVPNSEFYLSANVERDELKFKRDVKSNIDLKKFNTTFYGAEVGYQFAPGLLIAAGVKGYDNDYKNSADPTLRAKYVTNLNNGQAINLEAGVGFGDLDEWNLAADYYLDKTLSVGVDYYDKDHNKDYNIANDRQVGINARKFVTPQVSLEGRVGFGKADHSDYNTYGIAAKYRF